MLIRKLAKVLVIRVENVLNWMPSFLTIYEEVPVIVDCIFSVVLSRLDVVIRITYELIICELI